MDADVSALQRFSDVPYVIESPAANAPLATAAKMNAAAGQDLRLDTSRGVTPEHYHRIVEDIRRQLACDAVSRKEGYQIEIFDRAVADPMAEARKVDRTLHGFARNFSESKDTGPNATAYRASAKSVSCVVIGWKPGDTPAEVLGSPLGLPDGDTGGMTADQFQRQGIFHEVGHCLLGGSEAKADTFAALMMLRHSDLPTSAITALATFRELSEFTSQDPDDDHFISAALWRVAEMADQLRANPKFMAMDIGQIASVADTIGDRFASMPDEIRSIRTFRAALNGVAAAKTHYAVEPHGLRPTDFKGWLVANTAIPEIDRLVALSRKLSGGGGKVERARFDPQRLRTALSHLSERGDPTAKNLLKLMGRRMRPIHAPPEYMVGPGIPLPFSYRPSPLVDDIIGFDSMTQTVKFDASQQSFSIHDRFSDVVVRAGMAKPGLPASSRAEADPGHPLLEDAHSYGPRP
jgi:hypothetical protein